MTRTPRGGRIGRRLARLPLRIRLVLAATALLPLALGAVFGVVFLRFESAVNGGIDNDLRSRAEAVLAVVQTGGPRPLSNPAAQRLLLPQGALAQLLDGGDQVLDANLPSLARTPLLTLAQAERGTRSTIHAEREGPPLPGGRFRFIVVPAGDGRVLVVGRSVKGRERANESFARALLIGGPLSLVLAAAACYMAAALALRPVDDMREQAEEISADRSDARLPIPAADDEIARLGHTLNAMLDRLQRAHDQQRELVQNASHELRTPLSTLTAEIELALNDPTASRSSRRAMTRALEEARHVTRLADDLLVLAQLEENGIPLSPAVIDVTDTLHDAARRFAPSAAEEERSIHVTGGPVVATADPVRLQQAVGNLIDNALRHGRGDVTVDLLPSGNSYIIRVSDDGPGIDRSFAAAAFDRFVRGRTRAAGSGLGLAIVAAIVTAHGGNAHVDETGAIVLELPTVPSLHAALRSTSAASSRPR